MTTIFVDWLTFTLPFDMMDVDRGFMALTSDANRIARLLFKMSTKGRETPRHGYVQAWGLGEGAVLQYNCYRPEMGVNIVLPGQFLAAHGWRSFLARAVEQGHISRLDVTVDVLDPSFDLRSLYELVDAGQAKTKARSVSFITSKTGQTLYVGKRTSDRMLRIYDKGGEMGGQVGEHWRIEAEIKGRYAMSVARRMLDDQLNAYALFRSILDCPLHRGYTSAIGAEFTEVAFETEKRRKDTLAWLCGLVAKTIAAQEKLNPGTIQLVLQSVNQYLQ